MPSVLETIASDYRDYGTEAASEKLAKVVDSIKRAVVGVDRYKRTVGDLLNATDASGLASEAQEDHDHSVSGRETAISAVYKAAGIKAEEAAAWRKYARVEEARELAGIKKAFAVSGGRDIAADASVEDIAAMLKAAFVNPSLEDGEKAPMPTRKTIGDAAAAAGIGTDAAGTTPPKKEKVADSELQSTPAQERTAAVNTIVRLHAEGVELSKTEVKKLERILMELQGQAAALAA